MSHMLSVVANLMGVELCWGTGCCNALKHNKKMPANSLLIFQTKKVIVFIATGAKQAKIDLHFHFSPPDPKTDFFSRDLKWVYPSTSLYVHEQARLHKILNEERKDATRRLLLSRFHLLFEI